MFWSIHLSISGVAGKSELSFFASVLSSPDIIAHRPQNNPVHQPIYFFINLKQDTKMLEPLWMLPGGLAKHLEIAKQGCCCQYLSKTSQKMCSNNQGITLFSLHGEADSKEEPLKYSWSVDSGAALLILSCKCAKVMKGFRLSTLGFFGGSREGIYRWHYWMMGMLLTAIQSCIIKAGAMSRLSDQSWDCS